MNRFFISITLIVLLNCLLIVGAVIIGRHIQSPEAFLFAAGDCDQPCWHGIKPGSMTLDEAQKILSQLDFVSAVGSNKTASDKECTLTWTMNSFSAQGCIYADGDHVNAIVISGSKIPQKIVAEVFGSPTAAEVCRVSLSTAAVIDWYFQNIIEIDLYYPSHVYHPERSDMPAMVPAVTYHPPDYVYDPVFAEPMKWRGYTNILGTYDVGNCYKRFRLP